ncbi:HAMP domain-containing sensor histidine kinase [Ramlibacter sp. AN1015]|uniref:sensor histidine kinase n=1 Tax=Ramlibacter sp. AN1015 TaxID=3133428 RepID=UPI0030BBD7DB
MDRRILIRLLSSQDARLACRVLETAGIEAAVCDSDAALEREVARGALGALLIAEESFSEPVMLALGQALAKQPAWSDLPVLVLTKRGADSLESQRAMEKLGNVTVLERPLRTISLISAARSALRARARQYEMRDLNRRKDEFLATLAHELRNPLAPIVNAMAIVGRLHPSPKVDALVGMVDRQVRHLTRLVDDLLDVARITSGKLLLQPGPTSAAEVVNHAVEIAQEVLLNKGHQVQVRQPSAPIALQADHVRLVQGIANLLVNAAKFTPAGGEISLEVRHAGPRLEFVVTDTGRGIAAADLEQIFEMFEQTRVAGEPSSGLGLGLHLTRAFAQLHGGGVRAFSEGPGRGSTFVLWIQHEAAQVSAEPVEPAEPEALPQAASGR